MQKDEDISTCPSFNSYSSDKLAEIATKVGQEFTRDPKFSGILEGIDDEFEFSLVLDDPEASAAEVFYQGPVFPIFNRDLLAHDDHDYEVKRDEGVSTLRVPLKNMFIEDREEDEPPSSSSSEADELEVIPPGTYCVWRPKVVESSPSICKKSKSTGSASKRWKFRDLLRRSNSEGKDSIVFLTPKNKIEDKAGSSEKKERRNSIDSVEVKAKGVSRAGGKKSASSSAHELFYVQNRAMKEGDKKKSYLPYRQDLVGFFAKVNGIDKTAKAFPPLLHK